MASYRVHGIVADHKTGVKARSRVDLGGLGGVLSNLWDNEGLRYAIVEIHLISAICSTAHA